MTNNIAKKEEFRWSFMKKGTQVFNICKHLVFVYGFAAAVMTGAATQALANPAGGTVVGGSATITTSGTTETINQTTQNAEIKWGGGFNIAKGETTQINQPGVTSSEIEEVLTTGALTSINGNLFSNGRVVIMNPNGVIIGGPANIDTAGLIATTAGLANGSFNANTTLNNLNFSVAGNPNASVINQGNITVEGEGLVALVAPTVRNDGVITGNLSSIQLGAADTFGVDLYGDGLISLAVGSGTSSRTISATNTGSIIAPGGKVLMTAAAASNVVDSVINNTGVIEANSLQNVNGQIVLKAPGATTTVSGKLQAQGGNIETSGAVVNIDPAADIEAANWLIDPNNIEIGTTNGNTTGTTGAGTGTSFLSASNLDTFLEFGNVTVSTSGANGTNGADGNIKVDSGVTISPNGNHRNVTLTLDTSGDTGTNSGNVTISGTIGASGSNELGLTVNAHGAVSIATALATNGGAVSLTSADSTVGTQVITTGNGNVTVNADGAISTGAISTTDGGISLTSTNSGAITTGDLSIASTDGNAGALTVNAAGSLSVNGTATGNGTVSVTNTSGNGNSGDTVSLTSNGALNTGTITVNNEATSGNTVASVSLTTNTSGSAITTGDLSVNSDSGANPSNGSTLTVNSAGAFTVNGTATGNGTISVTNSDGGDPALYSQSATTLNANGNIQTGTVKVAAEDTDPQNFHSIATLGVTSTSGNIQTGGITVTADQSDAETGGSNGASVATATLTATKGTVTVTSGGINVDATAENKNTGADSTDFAEAKANAGLTINAVSTISLNGPVTSTSYVNSPDALSTGGSIATMNIASTGGELYFSQAPVAHAYDSQSTTVNSIVGAQQSDPYNGIDFNDAKVAATTGSSYGTQAYVDSGSKVSDHHTYTNSSGQSETCNTGSGCENFTLQTVTTNVPTADEATLTLSGLHTVVVTDNATKVYGTNDLAKDLGTLAVNFDYNDDTLNPSKAFDNTGSAAADVNIGTLTFSRVLPYSVATEQVGTDAITVNGVTAKDSTAAGNFTVVTNPLDVLTITTAPLTITAGNQNNPYGTYGLNPNLGTTAFGTSALVTTVDGVPISDAVTGVTLNAENNAPVSPLTSANFSSSSHLDAGQYAIVASGATGSGLSNYSITYHNGALTVSQLALAASIADSGSIYGSTLDPGAVTFSNAIAKDDVSAGAATVNTNTVSTSGNPVVGTYSQSVGSTLSGTDSGNYSFTGGMTTATNNYTISQLALTATIAEGDSVYGALLAPGAVTLNTVIPNDIVSAGTVAVNIAGNTSTSGNLTAGYHPGIEYVSSISGKDAANYSFSNLTGDYFVYQKELELTATGKDKVFDGNTSDPGASLTIASGIVGNDKVDVTYSPAPATFSNPSVGNNKAVTFNNIELTDVDSGNYTVAVPGASGNITRSFQDEDEGGIISATAAANITAKSVSNGPNTQFDALGRPIISVADDVINYYPPFEAIQTKTLDVDVSIKGGSNPAIGTSLANIEPAAGGDDDHKKKHHHHGTNPNDLSTIEPAAGGNGGNAPAKGNFACADAFLDGTACTAQ